jgi:Rab9 effector protein with kelch motifs
MRIALYTKCTGRKMVLHGGWDGNGRCFDDLWVFDTDSFQWLQPRTGGITPSPRYNHTMQLLTDGRILMYGGASIAKDGAVPVYHSDIRQLDTETMQWSKPRTTGTVVPGGRQGHTLCFTETDPNTAIIYGGWGLGGLQDSRTNKRSGAEGVCLFDTSIDSGYIHTPIMQNGGPPSRHGHTCTPVGSAVIVFGGWDVQQAVADLIFLEVAK